MIRLLKSNATKALKSRGLDLDLKHRWTEDGSQRYLWSHNDILSAVIYVVDRQEIHKRSGSRGSLPRRNVEVFEWRTCRGHGQ